MGMNRKRLARNTPGPFDTVKIPPSQWNTNINMELTAEVLSFPDTMGMVKVRVLAPPRWKGLILDVARSLTTKVDPITPRIEP
jgi:hypothetical protein